MQKRISLRMNAMVFSILCFSVGNANGWITVYSEDFSSDPGWVTDDAVNLRWESSTGTFHGTQVNTEGAFSYKMINGFNPQRSWRLTFDSRINSCDWSAGWDFGLFNDQLSYPNSIEVHQGIADGGHGTNHNSPFVNPGATYSPSWLFGTWYAHLLEYDASTGDFSLTVRERDNGNLFMERFLVTSVLPSDFTRLGVSRLHMKNTGAGASPSATVDYNLDNIVLSQVPEPTSCLILTFGGVILLRRRH